MLMTWDGGIGNGITFSLYYVVVCQMEAKRKTWDVKELLQKFKKELEIEDYALNNYQVELISCEKQLDGSWTLHLDRCAFRRQRWK